MALGLPLGGSEKSKRIRLTPSKGQISAECALDGYKLASKPVVKLFVSCAAGQNHIVRIAPDGTFKSVAILAIPDFLEATWRTVA